nr:type IIL restriction-modification enzyme MmeI [Paracoccus hibiscisoli]
MNAVEIEQAISELAEQPFDPAELPYAFLTAFGNKDTTIKRLRSGGTNKSDFTGPWGGCSPDKQHPPGSLRAWRCRRGAGRAQGQSPDSPRQGQVHPCH